ncbi:hypothetical protein QQZ08_003562 [Neonectria magnoliae]|uniref:Uncharacterized protein n=1 Tax=Neonectria magnoliae TaxID=2732573 RepID=A0ABR1I901_9HYPO
MPLLDEIPSLEDWGMEDRSNSIEFGKLWWSFAPNLADDWKLDHSHLDNNVFHDKMTVDKNSSPFWQYGAHEEGNSWLQYHSVRPNMVIEEPFCTYNSMSSIIKHVSYLQQCVTVLEMKTKDLSYKYWCCPTKSTSLPGFRLNEYWRIIQNDFAPLYRSFLETGDSLLLLRQCLFDDRLGWRHAIWIRMFVILTFGPNMEGIFSPRIIDGVFSTDHIILDGKAELEEVKMDPELSVKLLMKSLFRVSAVWVWTLEVAWADAHEAVVTSQLNRLWKEGPMAQRIISAVPGERDVQFLADFFRIVHE